MSSASTKTAGNNAVAKVEALLNPRNVVIVGATDKPGNWAQRVWRNLKRYNYPGKIYPFNPTRESVWDERCYRNFDELPEAPDHLIVLAPAKHVAGMLREAAAKGARSATVMSSGFDEAPEAEGKVLGAELRKAIEETGLAVSGPNCLGNFNAAASFFSMTDDRPHRFKVGPVAVFGQSGGIVMAIKRTLEERGIDTAALVTTGNETGLTTADYITYCAQAEHIRVIACYVESVHDPVAFLDALRTARAAGKPVVVMKLGASDKGREAAAAHTGALAGSMEAFDAIAGEAGALRVRNLDDMVEAVEFLTHAPLPTGSRLGSITFSGGMRGLLLDGAALNGLDYRPLSDATFKKLSEFLGVGTIIGNPLDTGFAGLTNPAAYVKSVETLLSDPDIDILLLQEELPRGPGSERKEANLRAVNELVPKYGKPVAFVTMISHGVNDYSRKLRDELPNLAFLQEVEKSLRAIANVIAYAERIGQKAPAVPAANDAGKKLLAEYKQVAGPATLDEVRSKSLLRAYGVPAPREELAKTEDQAVAAAGRIGYPVVAKLVSAAIPHKSDVGGVIVGIKNEADLRAAFAKIVSAVASLPGKPDLEGVLIAEMVSGGLELVLGASHDPEMGPTILFGAGGVDLELVRDVALAALPLDEARANALIDRTRVSKIIAGYRGRPALDRSALVKALVGLSHVVSDAGGAIDSIDINPFLLRTNGGVMLDALVVRKKGA
jgi:acyl-CoA synthetase (NDP forming)